MKASLDTGVVTMLAGGTRQSAIAVDATAVYWTEASGANTQGRIMKVPLAGGTPVEIRSVPSPKILWADSIAIDGTSIYWSEHASTADPTGINLAMKAPLSGGGATTLLEAPYYQLVGVGLVDDPNLYCVGNDVLMRVSVDGGTPTTLIPARSIWTNIAVDQTHFYWTIYYSVTGSSGVMSMEKPAPG
jgi:hypothetical protein